MPVPDGGLLVLLAHRGREAVPDLLPQGRAAWTAEEQVILDLNALAEGHTFMSLGAFEVSDDGRAARLHHRLDRLPRVHAPRQGPGAPASCSRGRVEKVGSLAWAADNGRSSTPPRTQPSAPYRLYRHQLGGRDEDTLLYEENGRALRSRWGARAAAGTSCWPAAATPRRNAASWPPNTPTGDWNVVAAREQDHEYYVDHRGDLFYIRTNDKGRELPARDRRPSPARARGLEGGRAPPRRRDARGRRPLRELLRAARARARRCPGCASPTWRAAHRTASTFPEPVYAVYPDGKRRVRHATFPLRLRVAGHAAPPSSTTT